MIITIKKETQKREVERLMQQLKSRNLEMYYTAQVNYNTGVPSPTDLVYYYRDRIMNNL